MSSTPVSYIPSWKMRCDPSGDQAGSSWNTVPSFVRLVIGPGGQHGASRMSYRLENAIVVPSGDQLAGPQAPSATVISEPSLGSRTRSLKSAIAKMCAPSGDHLSSVYDVPSAVIGCGFEPSAFMT